MTDAYLAGLVDGEGCFQINRLRMQNTRGTAWDWKWRHKLSLIVSMCDAPTLYAAAREFGGTVRKRAMKHLGENARQQWIWTIADKQAEACIRRILLHLRNKRPEALLALRFRETVAPPGKRPHYDASERQARIALEMKTAKRSEYITVGGVLLNVKQAHALVQPYAAPTLTVERT